MNRLDWTNWIRRETSSPEFVMAYGEWLEERLKVLPPDLVEVLAEEFCCSPAPD